SSVKEVNWVKPRKYRPSGASAVGVSVLSIPGSINDPGGPEVDLRLDSGADVTLISATYYAGLTKPPKLRRGRKMDLWQLTDKSAKIEGYVEVPVFATSTTGETVGLIAEAYVVPSMNVPILLGEDFQIAYELGVTRHVEFGTTVSIGDTGLKFEARGVQRPTRKRAIERASRVATVKEDVRIPANSCVNVAVDCSFSDSGTWLVEKSMVGDDHVAPLVVPNVLIDETYPRIPVSNTTSTARWLRRGETLGQLRDPKEVFDRPKNRQHWSEMAVSADRVAALM
ncbi:hypothetical protein BC629DRAFT_1271891, partial [Irpex lacteus]